MSNTAPLAFITGGSSGIGQALAEHYLQLGWRVAVVARREQDMRDWASTYNPSDAGVRVGVYAADVSDAAQARQAAQACIADMGLPDVVVANAGISVGVDTSEFEDLAALQRTLALNVGGLANTFHAFINPMRARGSGRLVGIASVAGIRGLPGHGAYCASKAGAIAYLESLRGELRGSGVDVVTVVPGYIATPLTAKNPYGMPFLMPAADFATAAVRAIAKPQSYVVIPWQMGVVAKLLRILPNALFDRLLSGRARKPRQPNAQP
jgi:short-subunit dehydrogenase